MQQGRVNHNAVQQIDTRFGSFLDALPDAVVIVGRDGNIAFANSQTAALFGYQREELIGRAVETLVAQHYGEHQARHRKGYLLDPQARPIGSDLELFGQRKNGEEFPVEISLSPVETTEGTFVSAAIRDSSQRKTVETMLRASLHEKEILLKEIHHRVKNNLQIVSSMLNLQMGQLADPKAAEMFQASLTRVRSVALFHETLYKSRDLGSVDVEEYLKRLVLGLWSTYGVDSNLIKLEIEVGHIPLSVDAAISLGLIVNELVSNAIKYAFPEGRCGFVRVILRSVADSEELYVSDDGIGISEDIKLSNPTTLGLRLVEILSEQLGAKISLSRHHGTHFSLSFRKGRT